MELIQEVIIDRFITKIQMSKARRPKYFKRGRSKALPLKYLDTSKYDYKPYKNSKKQNIYYLTDLIIDKRVIANIKCVGTPSYMSINAQNFYSGMSSHSRITLVTELKKFYDKNVYGLTAINDFPLHIIYTFYVTNTIDFDVDNLSWVYIKVFHDWLRKNAMIIPEDNIKYISGYTAKVEVVDTIDERKLQIQFFKK